MKKYIENLLARFEKLNRELPAISSGGCGVFAYHLYWFLKMRGLDPRIVVAIDSHDDFDGHVKNDREVHSTDHIVIKLGRYYFDNENIYTRLKDISFDTCHYYVLWDLDFLSRWNKRAVCWDRRFNNNNREKGMLIIENFFHDLNLEQLKNQNSYAGNKKITTRKNVRSVGGDRPQLDSSKRTTCIGSGW